MACDKLRYRNYDVRVKGSLCIYLVICLLWMVSGGPSPYFPNDDLSGPPPLFSLFIRSDAIGTADRFPGNEIIPAAGLFFTISVTAPGDRNYSSKSNWGEGCEGTSCVRNSAFSFGISALVGGEKDPASQFCSTNTHHHIDAS